MVRLVSFDDATEARVRFVEETPREAIVGLTMARLEAGENPRDLITAAALAVSRSCELPADHHGGPIHPVAGIHAVMGMTGRLSGQEARLPVLQCLALANKHINLPSMGPSAMVAFDDLKRDVDAERVLARLEKALTDREGRLAERALTLACEKTTLGRILDALLTVALGRNNLDDHYLLYPIYALRSLEAIGWEWAPIVLRPAMRYLARHHPFDAYGEFSDETVAEGIGYYRRFGEIEALLETYGLTPERVPQSARGDEGAAITALADAIGEVASIAAVPELVARALGRGLSLEGACEAMSLGGARIFLRSHSNNPFDVHIHTGLAARRYIVNQPEVRFRFKVLALLGWAWSYEVRYLDATLQWTWSNVPDLPADSGAQAILAEIERHILAIDGYDVTNLPGPITDLVAPEGVRQAVRLAETYMRAGHDPEALFALTTRLVCREDASEMHAYKLQQVAWEEFHACRSPLNWVHAVAAVKQAGVAAPTGPHRVWPDIAPLLAA